MVDVPERLNPLLKPAPLEAADEAACKLDGMFRDIFNKEERLDLIVTIIRAATGRALGIYNAGGSALTQAESASPPLVKTVHQGTPKV